MEYTVKKDAIWEGIIERNDENFNEEPYINYADMCAFEYGVKRDD